MLVPSLNSNTFLRKSAPKSVRVMYAQGIVALFPYLEDPYSQHGYVSKSVISTLCPYSLFGMFILCICICLYVTVQEHYCDPESGSGYLEWRLKTIQRNTAEERGASGSKSPKGEFTYQLRITDQYNNDIVSCELCGRGVIKLSFVLSWGARPCTTTLHQ